MDTFLKDIRHSLRMFLKNPGFTATAVAALALGIGANTAIFSVIDAVLLRPLAYPEPDRIVQLMLKAPNGGVGNTTSIPKFNVWRQQDRVFQDVAAYDTGGPGINLTGGDRPEQLRGIHVSYEYFRLFGAPVAIGRTFTAEEDRPGGAPVAVMSDGLWRRRFGANPTVVGQPLILGGEPYTVIGVLGPQFNTDSPTDLFLPLKADPNSVNQAHYLRAAARLKPGVTLQMADQQMQVAADQFRQKFPRAMPPNASFTARPLRDIIVSNVRTSLYVLVGAVGFVLLIACANVANLLLVRATGRKREMAIRAAIGAGRGRIIRQLLTESVLLSLAGGLLGLGLGWLGVRALLAMNPGNIPRIGENGSAIHLDARVLLFTLAVSVLTGILFGLIPALSSSRPDLGSTLKESTSRSGSGFRQNKARSVLVITEMALAMILLIGAALLIRTFMALRAVDTGFDTHNVLTMEMSLTGSRFDKTAGVAQLVRDGVQRLEGTPGVEAASTTCCLPLEGGLGLPFVIEGRPLTDGQYHGGGAWRTISAHYFDVFKIKLKAGRLFTDRDDGGAAGVVIINESMAREFWRNASPLGERLSIGKGMGGAFNEPPREIIGVVADVRDGSLSNEPGATMFVPASQINDGVTKLNAGFMPLIWTVRTKSEPYSMSTTIQNELRAGTGLPVANVRSMDRVRVQSTASTDFNTLLLTIFAGTALLLAAIGIYGLMAYAVQQRTQEIGIRIALGAAPGKMRNMVVRQGMILAIVGIVIGVGGALALTRFIAGFLYQVQKWDPVVFVTVSLTLGAVALLATYIPARRATRVDPIVALRYE